jgi:hypothetical protein
VLEVAAYVGTIIRRIQMSAWKLDLTIMLNNSAILLSLAKPYLQGGHALITSITEAINRLSEMEATVNLQPP